MSEQPKLKTREQYQRERPKPSKQADLSLPDEWPSDELVRGRYRRLFVEGRQKGSDAWNTRPWLYVFDFDKKLGDMKGGTNGQCCGPRWKDFRSKSGKKAPVRSCRSLLCPFCWTKQMHTAKVNGLWRHANADAAIKFSMSLPAIRTDPYKFKEAKETLRRALKRWDYDFTVFIHVFGEDLRQGPKGHFDGVVSVPDGEVDAKKFALRMEALLGRFCGKWAPHCEAREIEARKEGSRGELTHHQGMLSEIGISLLYAGRNTFRTDRLWAGQYVKDGRPGYRALPLSMTRRDVGAVKGDQYEMTDLQVVEAINTAEQWRGVHKQPIMSAPPKDISRAHARDLFSECSSSVFYRASLNERVVKRARRR